MSVANYKMLFEQDVRSALTVEEFAGACLGVIEEAEERAEKSYCPNRIRLDALNAIKLACLDLLDEQTLELMADEASQGAVTELTSMAG